MPAACEEFFAIEACQYFMNGICTGLHTMPPSESSVDTRGIQSGLSVSILFAARCLPHSPPEHSTTLPVSIGNLMSRCKSRCTSLSSAKVTITNLQYFLRDHQRAKFNIMAVKSCCSLLKQVTQKTMHKSVASYSGIRIISEDRAAVWSRFLTTLLYFASFAMTGAACDV